MKLNKKDKVIRKECIKALRNKDVKEGADVLRKLKAKLELRHFEDIFMSISFKIYEKEMMRMLKEVIQ